MKIFLPIVLILTGACNDHHHRSLQEQLDSYDKNITRVESDTISKTRLDGFKYQPSQWHKKKDFNVLERYSNFELKKCQDCHGSNKKIPKNISNHKEITLHHANKSIMNCSTCHNKKDKWNLHSMTGETISINHPYKLCSQCHFQQADDWAGGAHGKRVGGWHGKRVIQNCTDCHNPHAPQFHKQMPAVTPNFLQYKKVK